MEFDQFVKLPVSSSLASFLFQLVMSAHSVPLFLVPSSSPSLQGCTKSSHIPKASAPPPLPSTSTPASSSSAPTTISSSGKETYGSAPPPKPAAPSAPTAIAAAAPVVPKEIIEEQDEPGMEIPEGAKCKRRGCGVKVGSEKEECVYHPGAVSSVLLR